MFPLRKCHNVPKSPCLYYHIGQCLAPCINKVSRDEYDKIIDNIRNFLKGKNQELTKDLKEKIKKCSDALEFERAQEFKKMLDSINHITEKQNVEFKDKINRDFFSFHTRENYIAIALFSYREGILLSKRSFCYELIGEINEFVSEIIYQYYSINAIPNEVIVSNEEIKDNLMNYFENANVFAPTKGKLHDVLDICEINAKEALDEHFLTAKLDDDVLNLLDKLGNILHIKTPTRIELFDNSHLQGTNAMGAMVVFINGIPYKKLYRKFNIQGVNKKDDLSSMRETLTRRYKRVKEENGEMPDLIIVDGGKGQIETALEVKKALNLPFSIAGLVKTSKHRTSALMDENFNEYYLDDEKKLFLLLTRMQDEVHRYAITTHIKKRNKSVFNSVFDDVDGIGEKRKEQLIKAFPSISELKNAKIEELEQIIPKESAKLLYEKVRKLN